MTRTLRLPYLRHQLAVFDSPARNLVYVKGRRAGGTRGAVTRLIELAHTGAPTRHLWVDTVHRNIDRYVQSYFRPLLQGTDWRWDRPTRTLWFESGSCCDFGSAQRPETLEGFAYDAIWVNEAGLVLRDEALYYQTLLPMVAENPRARMVFVGAPKGGGGLFQRMYEWGQDPARPDWASFRHTSFANPLLNPETLETLRGHMPERVYRQEVLAEFVADEEAVFSEPEAAATAEPEAAPDPGAPYVLGVDLARQQDWSVVWVGRTDTREAVHCERFQGGSWSRQVARIAAVSEAYGWAPAYVDATGLGDPVCEALEAQGVPVEPVVFSAGRKRQLVEALALALEQARLRLVPHETTLRELRQFRYETAPGGAVRLRAPPGGHDDCVLALALCHWGLTRWNGTFMLGAPLAPTEAELGGA